VTAVAVTPSPVISAKAPGKNPIISVLLKLARPSIAFSVPKVAGAVFVPASLANIKSKGATLFLRSLLLIDIVAPSNLAGPLGISNDTQSKTISPLSNVAC
jgi:hypothetical protein